MRHPRNTELLLLLAASPVVLLAFALVLGADSAALTWPDLAVPAGLVAAFVAAHVAVRVLAPSADPVLLPLMALLGGLGLAVITRLDPDRAASQLLWLLVGVGVFVATLASVRSLERLARYKYTVMLAGLALLLAPALFGREVNGAKLWLSIGGLSFQPAEVAKVLIVLFLAAYLAENREVLSVSTRRVLGLWMPPARQLGPLIAMWAISLVVLVMEKDLGSSLLFFGIFLVMLFAATGRPSFVLVGALLFSGGATAAYLLFGHVRTRIEIWLDPFADVAGRGYQLAQSLFALAAGGLTGTGLGRGLPTRIPFVETDFAFAAIGEELGLLGGAAIILVYLVFCLRGMATATRARSDMAALTATGLVAAFALQTFVIIGGVTRLIPLTGITLPFVSYGGSSVLANSMLVALLLRASTERVSDAEETNSLGSLGRSALTARLEGIAAALALMLAALVVNLTYIQVVRAEALAAHPANTRGLAEELKQARGAILTADGIVLAESVRQSDGVYDRSYPAGALAAHVVGYFSPRYGRAGVEASHNSVLAGRRVFATYSDFIAAAAGHPVVGNDVELTIDSRVQKAAEAALAGHRGAVVAIEPSTGRVLAMASAPTYEPELVDAEWERLSAAGGPAPLVDRAAMSLYPPGSTFKVVTLTGALASGVASPSTSYPGPGRIEIGGAPVTNFEGGSYGRVDLRKALASSVNTVFAQLAVDMGSGLLVDTARAFGFGEAPPIEIPSKPSLMPDPAEMTKWETAWAGVGQPVGEHRSPPGPQVTPVQMALVASAIGNGGVAMAPYLVERVTDPAGRTLERTTPRMWVKATDENTAAKVREMMVGVVESGSGGRARLAGTKVAGKTGTAEAGKAVQTHAWFIAFAPAENPEVAVAVLLENAGLGGRVAAPAAKQVMEVALSAK